LIVELPGAWQTSLALFFEKEVGALVIFTADPSDVLNEICLEAGADFYLHKTQLQELIDICSEQLAQK